MQIRDIRDDICVFKSRTNKSNQQNCRDEFILTNSNLLHESAHSNLLKLCQGEILFLCNENTDRFCYVTLVVDLLNRWYNSTGAHRVKHR